MAVYENSRSDFIGYGLFQIRNHDWCDHGRNRCHMSCSGRSLLPCWGLWRVEGSHVELRGLLSQWPEFTSLELKGGGPGEGWAEPDPEWGRRRLCRTAQSPQGERAVGLVAWDAARETHVQMGRGGGREEHEG